MLVGQLPLESATVRATNGTPSVEWGLAEHLLALTLDAVRVGNWQRQGNSKAPRPLPVQRPGMAPPPQRLGGRELAARLVDQRNRKLKEARHVR